MLRWAEISSVEGVRLGSLMKKRDREEVGGVGVAMKVRSGMK